MRELFTPLLALSLLAAAALAQNNPPAADGKMTAEDRARLVKLLKDSQAEFLAEIESLSEAQWAYKPNPARWSVAETAEHILLSEGLLFGVAERALAAPANPNWQSQTAGKDALLERALLNRSVKAEAPAPIQPKRKLSRAETIELFKEARAKTIRFVEQTDLPLRAHTQDHPFKIFSTLNAYQWVLYVPLHCRRHILQIQEIKASEGYPKA